MLLLLAPLVLLYLFFANVGEVVFLDVFGLRGGHWFDAVVDLRGGFFIRFWRMLELQRKDGLVCILSHFYLRLGRRLVFSGLYLRLSLLDIVDRVFAYFSEADISSHPFGLHWPRNPILLLSDVELVAVTGFDLLFNMVALLLQLLVVEVLEHVVDVQL